MTKITSSYASTANTTVKNRRFNLRYLNISLFVSIAICGALYLVNINDLTVQGFVLRDLKSQVNTAASLKADNEEAVNSLQAYSSVSERTRNLNMVAVGDVEYLAMGHSAVARK